MTEHVIRFNPHGLTSPEVQQRISEGSETVMARMDRINARLEVHWSRFNRRAVALMESPRNLDYKIPAYWEIADELSAYNGDDVACRKGCSHCCYAAVLVPHAEADVIGKRIKRKPERAKQRRDAKDVPYGYDHPCTFLVNEECSIYANRPTVCRVHYSLDVDALMCELTPPESKPVPFLNDLGHMTTLLQLIYSVTGKRPLLGEIKEFWPRLK